MNKLKLNTKVAFENNYLKTTMNLYINNHYLCTVTLHNSFINEIQFLLHLPKTCGGSKEIISFTDNLFLEGLSSVNIYQLYKKSLDRYWKNSIHKETMLNYHLSKANKYQ